MKEPISGLILGYFVDEYTTATGNNRWRIDTVSGTTIQMNALEQIGRFNYDLTVTTVHDGVTYSVSEFQPARIIIWKKKPIINLIFHRLVKSARNNQSLSLRNDLLANQYNIDEHLSS